MDTKNGAWDLLKSSGLVSGAWSGMSWDDLPKEYQKEWVGIVGFIAHRMLVSREYGRRTTGSIWRSIKSKVVFGVDILKIVYNGEYK